MALHGWMSDMERSFFTGSGGGTSNTEKHIFNNYSPPSNNYLN